MPSAHAPPYTRAITPPLNGPALLTDGPPSDIHLLPAAVSSCYPRFCRLLLSTLETEDYIAWF